VKMATPMRERFHLPSRNSPPHDYICVNYHNYHFINVIDIIIIIVGFYDNCFHFHFVFISFPTLGESNIKLQNWRQINGKAIARVKMARLQVNLVYKYYQAFN
jgi:hypothetical protein